MSTFIRRPIGERSYRREDIPQKSNIFWQKFSRIIIYLILFFVLFAIFIYVLPRAEITIVTEKREISGSVGVTLDTTVSENETKPGVIPALHFTKQFSIEESFSTTGSLDIGNRARGSATFSNRTGIDWPLLSDHRIRGGENKLYRVFADIQIPKATVSPDGEIVPGSIEVALEAEFGGEAYNLPQGKILALLTVPPEKQDRIFGYVSQDISGGTSQVVQSVSREDASGAELKLITKARKQALEEFSEKFGDGYVLSDSLVFSVRVATSTKPSVNEPGTEVAVSLNAEFGGIAVKKKFIEEAIAEELSRKGPLAEGEALLPDVAYELAVIAPLNEGAYAAKATLQFKGFAAPSLPVEEITLAILGEKERTARLYVLSQKGVRDVHFNYSWNLLRSIPDNPKKVLVKIQ